MLEISSCICLVCFCRLLKYEKPHGQTVLTQIRLLTGAVGSGPTLFASILTLGKYMQWSTLADNIFRCIILKAPLQERIQDFWKVGLYVYYDFLVTVKAAPHSQDNAFSLLHVWGAKNRQMMLLNFLITFYYMIMLNQIFPELSTKIFRTLHKLDENNRLNSSCRSQS